ncbi:MAG TPA: NFACT RNA binding domain-containing protein [Acidobacteriota bacterium]|nr:NFACT RNA binding domain-containing protein [Acidobacteriota bacterium]
MQFTLDLTQSLTQNAASYFDKAKKSKKKKEGVHTALAITRKKLQDFDASAIIAEQKSKSKTVARKGEWFEKFRWGYTTSGFLAVGGRDAESNEVIVKKYMEPTDIVFHTEMAGSPFFLLKCGDKKPTEQDIIDIATLTCVYSKAWQKGFSSVAVFYVEASQVSKEANSGEYMSKGSFMIRGHKSFLHPPMELFVSKEESGRLIVGTQSALSKRAPSTIRIIPGSAKPTDVAKKVATQLNAQLDECVKMLPSGGLQMTKVG